VDGEFSLKQQRFGAARFARVTVSVAEAELPSVVLGDQLVDWVHDAYGSDAWTDSALFDGLRNGALFGAIYALHRVGRAALVTVTMVHGTPTDSREEDVRYATAFAVWDALGEQPDQVPWIDEAGVHFPNGPRV
jgi:hypothetical protein